MPTFANVAVKLDVDGRRGEGWEGGEDCSTQLRCCLFVVWSVAQQERLTGLRPISAFPLTQVMYLVWQHYEAKCETTLIL